MMMANAGCDLLALLWLTGQKFPWAASQSSAGVSWRSMEGAPGGGKLGSSSCGSVYSGAADVGSSPTKSAAQVPPGHWPSVLQTAPFAEPPAQVPVIFAAR